MDDATPPQESSWGTTQTSEKASQPQQEIATQKFLTFITSHLAQPLSPQALRSQLYYWIRQQANIYVQDANGITAMEHAAQHGDLYLARLLFDSGNLAPYTLHNAAQNASVWQLIELFNMGRGRHTNLFFISSTEEQQQRILAQITQQVIKISVPNWQQHTSDNLKAVIQQNVSPATLMFIMGIMMAQINLNK